VLGFLATSGQFDNAAMPVPRPSDVLLMSWNTPGDVEELRKLFMRFRDTVRTLFS
jgi:hypothetical protein